MEDRLSEKWLKSRSKTCHASNLPKKSEHVTSRVMV